MNKVQALHSLYSLEIYKSDRRKKCATLGIELYFQKFNYKQKWTKVQEKIWTRDLQFTPIL